MTTLMTQFASDVQTVISKRRAPDGKFLSAQDVESLTLLRNHLEMCDWHNPAKQDELIALAQYNLEQSVAQYGIQYNDDTTFTIFECREYGSYLVGVAASNAVMRNSETHPYQLVPDNDSNHLRMVQLTTFLRILNVVPGRVIDAAIVAPGTMFMFYGPAIGD